MTDGFVSMIVTAAMMASANPARNTAAATGTAQIGLPERPPIARPAPQAASPENSRISGLKRWFDLQAGSVALRYRTITNSSDVRTTNHMQHNQGLRARLRMDPAGRYTVNFGAFSGSNMTGSWNNTGLGTGDRVTNVYLKQLFVAGVPWRGVEVQYGSLYFVRGENTEITTYDNDAYMVGLRASVKRPKMLFFDELSATRGYLSPKAPPSVFDRGSHFQRANYWQALAGKRLGSRVAGSLDVTRALERDTVRAAMTMKAPALRVVETVRVEGYRRLAAEGSRAAGGYVLYAERTISKGVIAGGGWADIDENYGGLNADRFNAGRRLFVNGSASLTPEVTVQTFYTFAPSPRFAIGNRTRFDLVVSYNVLKALQRKGVL